jgi:hypothetical protein
MRVSRVQSDPSAKLRIGIVCDTDHGHTVKGMIRGLRIKAEGSRAPRS